MLQKIKDILSGESLFCEICRYLIVGGLAFLVDFGVLVLFAEIILPKMGGGEVYIATALGFIAGLTFNYIFSIVFVFLKAKGKGKTVGAFLVFAIIGVIGLLLTEAGMYIGYDILKINYMIVKVIVTIIVLGWNYTGRKILIFR